MSFLSLRILTNKSLHPLNLTCQRWFAAVATPKPAAALGKKMAKKGGKLGPVVEKKVMPVETDANKLVNYVCGSNILIKGEELKLKPDNEYPEWLWSIHTGPPKTLQEFDPETKQYWRKLRQISLRRNNQLQKIRKF